MSRMKCSTRLLVWLSIVSAAVVAYWDVWTFDYISLDDDRYAFANPHVIGGLSRENIGWAWTSLECSNWHPLTWMSLMMDVTVFGAGAAGFHITNLALHLLNALLVFELLFRVTGYRDRSACVAFLFAIHPVHAESVAWISERKDVLSTFFGLIALRAYTEYVLRRDAQWYLGTIVAFVLTLLAKQTLVTLPCLLLVLDVWPLGRLRGIAANGNEVQREGILRLVREKVPLFLITIVFSVVVVFAQDSGGAIKTAPLLSRLADASLACVLYLKSLFVPAGLALFYPRTPFANPVLVLTVCGSVLGLLTIGAFRLRKRAAWLLVGWLWYLGTLVPVSGIVQIGSAQRADRYLYVPAIGIYLVVVWIAAAGFERLRLSNRARVTLVAASLWVLLCASFLQVRTWRNSLSVWSHAASVTHENGRAERMTCTALLNDGRLLDAERHCLRAMAIEPDHAGAHQSLAHIRFLQDRFSEAHTHFERSLELDPEFTGAHFNLAMLYWEEGSFDKAELSLRRAVETDSDHAQSLLFLARLLAAKERYEEARRFLMRAKSSAPNHPGIRGELRQLAQRQQH